MNTTITVILCVLAALVLLITAFVLYRKKRILEMLTERYGKPSTRNYDERDFMYISQLFNLFPAAGKETVDDITWNDVQMPIIYKQMNHSVSHIGDEYLYRHVRTQQYGELDRLEKHIRYFDEHPEERLKLQYAFYKINPEVRIPSPKRVIKQMENQPAGNDYFSHLKNPDLLTKISVIPSIVILILAVMACLSNLWLSPEDGLGILAIMLVFVGSLYNFIFFMRKAAGFISTLKTFSESVTASVQIAKVDSAVFDKELQTLIPALKKLQRKSRLMNMLVNICMMQNRSATFLSLITIFFGFYGFVYLWVAKTIKNNTKEAMIFYENIGYIELCISQSSYRKTLSYYCAPEFSQETQIKFDELYHPLLHNPVTNSRAVNPKFIITGANASGKSTFAKTLAVNAITSQTINICYAKKFSMHPACVYTTMNLEDDIISGNSFYVAEIKRLKGFLDSLNDGSYKMFFADEILKGTNTMERIAAASAILKKFAENNCFVCLTTHDTELTGILQNYYTNYHFKEITTDTAICYDYKLYDGVTPGSNAIALLKYSQYAASIVEEASRLAQHYLNCGEWEILNP